MQPLVLIVNLISSRYYRRVPSESTYELIERFSAILRAEERQAGLANGLQPVHMQILAYLARCNRYSDTPLALSEYLGIQKGTISQSLRILTRDGYVARQADPTDDRLVHLSLTAAGRKLVTRVLPPGSFRKALRELDSAGSAILDVHLEVLLRALQRVRGGRAFGVCQPCRHFEQLGRGFPCGLTLEPMRKPETERICRERERPAGRVPT